MLESMYTPGAQVLKSVYPAAKISGIFLGLRDAGLAP